MLSSLFGVVFLFGRDGALRRPRWVAAQVSVVPPLRDCAWRRERDSSAGFPACGCRRLSSRQLPGNTRQECRVNSQTRMSALPQVAAWLPMPASESGFKSGAEAAAVQTLRACQRHANRTKRLDFRLRQTAAQRVVGSPPLFRRCVGLAR